MLKKDRKISGYHESPKAGRVHYRSSWELEVYKQLDNDPTVITYQEVIRET